MKDLFQSVRKPQNFFTGQGLDCIQPSFHDATRSKQGEITIKVNSDEVTDFIIFESATEIYSNSI